MLRARARQLQTLMQAADVALPLSVLLFLTGRQGWAASPTFGPILDPRILAPGLVAVLAWPLVLDRLRLYGSNRRAALSEILGCLLVAACVSTSLLGAGLLALGAPVAATFPVACGLLQLGALAVLRLGIYAGLRGLRRAGRNYRNVMVVGSGRRAREVRDTIEHHPEWGLRIAAYLDEVDAPVCPDLGAEKIHKLSELPSLLAHDVIDEVILACPRTMLGSIRPLVGVCASTGIPVTLPSDLFGDLVPPPLVGRFGSQPALRFAPVHHSSIQLALKRAIDVVGATLLLVASLPLLAVAALLIRATSPGPVIFRQIRCGLHGRTFVMWKLRTMREDAEREKAQLLDRNEMQGPVFKMHDDPRVTPVGRFLRRWSLDELPQLWNVLRGEMSLVGPRPAIPGEVLQYQIPERRRLSMRPGLTCIWQVSGRNGIPFDDWVKLDLDYIDSWSLAKDFGLILRTLPAVVSGRGAS